MKHALQNHQTKKILIIEDEGDMCLLLNILLNGGEFELDHVKNLAAARDYLERQAPAVIILDNKLPDGFGVDFVAFIKQHYPGIRVIMISGFDSAVEDVAIENGADFFLKKPFTRRQFDQSLELVMN